MKHWDYAIDVGAFVGIYTRHLAKRFKCVIAIEPNLTTFEFLCLNTIDEEGVTRVHAAASDTERDAVRIQRKAWPSCRVSEKDETGWQAVPSTTLNRLDIRPGLIKIDVEGYEYRVLRGADALLKHRPVVVIEEGPYHKRYGDPNPIEYLKGLGMEIVARHKPDVVMAWK